MLATIAVYGTATHPWTLAGVVTSTAIVLWIAHLYSHALSESIHQHEPLRVRELLVIARRELGIVRAAALPVAALLLGAAGIVKENSAVWLAIALGLGTLAVQGVRYARLESFGAWGTTAAVCLNVALGLLVALLKVGLSH